MADTTELDALVVGAGFGGVYSLYKLRSEGYSVKIFEAGSDFGGIWYWNRYPGARVDSDLPMYEYRMESLWKDWKGWTQRFPEGQEIRNYFDYVDTKLDIKRDVQFNTRVIAAEFDKQANRWIVSTEAGAVVRPKFLVLCTGIGAKPYTPNFKGLANFKGAQYHAATWPTEHIDLTGKRVGIVGTGATGVQIIQEIGPVVGDLTVFQRTPNLALPMGQYTITPEAHQKLKDEIYPMAFRRRTQTFAGFHFDFTTRKATEASEEEREFFYQDIWARGGFNFWVGTYFDVLTDQAINDEAYAFWRKKVVARIVDPKMQELLAPTVSPHPFGTKRPSLESTYYEVFNQPNISIVDVNKSPIAEITAKGLRTEDGVEHCFDVLILATGYDAMTGGLTQIDIKGIDGVTLKEKWAPGVASYLGCAINGFPNLFYMYGPQGPSVFSNGPSIIVRSHCASSLVPLINSTLGTPNRLDR